MNYADEGTERKLVQAVKEAAARIDYNNTPDPEGVLAECLTKYGFSSKFAKTATDAANKSYTVHYMSTHDDDTRGNDHPLLDYKKVQAKMVGESVPSTGSVKAPSTTSATLTITHAVPKTASVKVSSYTPRTYSSGYDYVNFLSSGMVKLASSLEDLMRETDGYTEKFFNAFHKVKQASLDQKTVDALYSQGYTGITATMNALGLHPSVQKTAMIGTSKKSTKQLVEDNRTSRTIYNIHKAACDLSDLVEVANNVKGLMKDDVDALNTLNAAYDRAVFSKHAAKGDDSSAAEWGQHAANIGAGYALGPELATIGLLTGGMEGVGNIAEHTKDLIEASQDVPSYSSVLDADFIRDDRRIKNMEAWAEVASDPNLSKYPLTDLYSVTKRLLQANPQFEKPIMYPMLVDTVSQVMSQGGRIGLGLHGSTSKTLSDISKSLNGLQSGNIGETLKAPISGKVDAGSPVKVFDTAMIKEVGDNLPASISNLYQGTIAPAVQSGAKLLGKAIDRGSDAKKLEDMKLQADLLSAQSKLEDEQFRATHEGKSKKDYEQAEEKKKLEEQAKVDAENQVLAEQEFMNVAKADKEIYKDVMKDPIVMRRLYEADSEAFKDDAIRSLVTKIPALTKYPELLNSLTTGNIITSTGGSANVNTGLLKGIYARKADLINRTLNSAESNAEFGREFAMDPVRALHTILNNNTAPLVPKK